MKIRHFKKNLSPFPPIYTKFYTDFMEFWDNSKQRVQARDFIFDEE